MISPNSYLLKIITRRRADANLEALRKSVENMVLVGDRKALLTQKRLIETDDEKPKEERMEIVDAGLNSLNSQLMKEYVAETNALDAIIDGRAEDQIAFTKQNRGTDAMKRFNARLAERQQETSE